MKTELLPKQSIIVGQETSVLVRFTLEKKKANINNICGLLKKYKGEYSSVELQHKAKEWWSNVSA